MKTATDIVVVGGGIGGLAVAYGLAKYAGKKITVLEQAPEFAEVGAGIQLAPNALRMLDMLGVLEEVYAYSVFPRRHVFMDAIEGRELSPVNFGEAFRERYGYPYIVIHRSDLHSVLLEACNSTPEVNTLSDHKVVDIRQDEKKAYVTCENGAEFEADLVVGADGLWSTVRKVIVDDEPICSSYVAYRGTVPMDEMKVQIDWDEKYTWIGPGLHMVQYPIRQKKEINQVAVFKSSKYLEGEETWGTPEELDEAYSKCCDTLLHSLKYMQRERKWNMYDRDPIDNWSVGRVTLLGDAAHPMKQYLAQGGCQALEDAISLTDKMIAYTDMEQVLSEYQKERIPRASKVQVGARLWGDIKHLESQAGILLRNELMLKRDGEDYEYLDWMYGAENTPTLHNQTQKA